MSVGGRLLVATPDLGDPNFDRSVVYVVQHDEQGAIGVVLNRRSETRVESEFAGLGAMASTPAVFFVGGPVAEGAVVALGRRTDVIELVELEPVVDGVVDPPGDLRLFVGYAGWGPRQLDAEVATGSWLVVDAVPDDVFSMDPDGLWRSVLRRQPGPISKLALYPDDVMAN